VAEDRRAHHQLVGAGALREGLQLAARGVWRADERTGEHAHRLDLVVRHPVGLDVVDRGRHQSAPAAHHVHEALLQARGQAPRLGVGVRDDHVDARHRVRPRELLGRLEVVTVDADGSYRWSGAQCDAKP
jgi:hypothetical protein